ncbi:uncharacterized protein LOC126851103 [Cataglyphis hispanica]|uniref:uncharacterized protein LOC126851103 n=1 Tax=Cataglyphis hispanica TaxID=1086592 RepID=UPI00217FC934|nr:uncharacterized protein LOC126851103 [Cataglyphis hispanica]
MNSRSISALVLIYLVREAIAVRSSIAVPRGFLIYRTISITQRSCNCLMSFSCSCCQNVIIRYTKEKKDLCVNFTYQRNGLNVDVTLSSDTISARTITNFKALQFCVHVPGSLFSSACINMLELNLFPTSITVRPRLDIYATKQLWQINYNCINVSMELPMMPVNNTTRMADMTNEETSTAENEQMEPSMESSMTSGETMTTQTSEANGMAEQLKEITEVSELILKETEL